MDRITYLEKLEFFARAISLQERIIELGKDQKLPDYDPITAQKVLNTLEDRRQLLIEGYNENKE